MMGVRKSMEIEYTDNSKKRISVMGKAKCGS